MTALRARSWFHRYATPVFALGVVTAIAIGFWRLGNNEIAQEAAQKDQARVQTQVNADLVRLQAEVNALRAHAGLPPESPLPLVGSTPSPTVRPTTGPTTTPRPTARPTPRPTPLPTPMPTPVPSPPPSPTPTACPLPLPTGLCPIVSASPRSGRLAT